MKQLELINEYVRNNSKAEDVLKSMKNGKIPGVKATDIQKTSVFCAIMQVVYSMVYLKTIKL